MVQSPNQNYHKSKSLIVDSVMKNSELSRQINDALSAPIGSTKRKEALSILKSINRVGQRYFGQGGPMDYSALTVGGNKNPLSGMGQLGTINQSGEISEQTTPYQMFSNVPTERVPYTQQATKPKVTTQQQQQPLIPAGSYQPVVEQPVDSSYSQEGMSMVPEISTFSGSTIQQQMVDFVNNMPQSFEEAWQNFSDTDKKKTQTLYDSVKAGLGPEYYAWQVMNSEDIWNQMGLPAKERPTGAILVNQLKDLESRLKTEYNLEEQGNKLRQMQTTGVTLESDLKSYIKTKDENIKEIDNLIRKTQDATKTMDMADPDVYNRVKGYMDYLTVLKGRQQKRYDDYLNDSINMYNNQIKVTTEQFNNDKATFLDDYRIQSSSITGDFDNKYNAMTSMLNNMYTNAANMKANSTDMWSAQAQQLANAESIISNVFDSQEVLQETNIYRFSKVYDDFFTPYLKQTKIEGDVKKTVDMISGDIADMMNKAPYVKATEGESLSSADIPFYIKESIQQNIDPAIEKGMLGGFFSNYQQMIDSYANKAAIPSTGGGMTYDQNIITNAYNLANSLISSVSNYYQNKLSENPEQLNKFTSAINDLTGYKTGFMGAMDKSKVQDSKEKAKWINKYGSGSEKIDPFLLEAIHTYFYNQEKVHGQSILEQIPPSYFSKPEAVSGYINSGLWMLGDLSNVNNTYAELLAQTQ